MTQGKCFVVVRGAGERTEAACARLAGLEVGDDNVRVIHEVPFSAAVRRGFEIGVEAGLDWTLCLDADVLLRPGAIGELRSHADREWQASPDLFEIEGLVADKLLGQFRPAGAHLYRTSLLGEALAHASFDARKRRPERQVKKQMRAMGFRTVQVDTIMGLHDYEQRYLDLFRKVYTHTRKHERFMTYAPRYWRRLAPEDGDFRVAFLSYTLSAAINEHTDFSAMAQNEKVSIDLRSFPGNLDAILVPAGMAEKPPLAADAIASNDVETRLRAFVVAPEYERDRPVIAAANRGRWDKFLAYVDGYGSVGALRELGARRASAFSRWLDARG